MSINPDLIRAARGFLNWTVADLGQRVGVRPTTISAIENSKSNGSVEVLGGIEKAFLAAGVEFTSEGGLRPSRYSVQLMHGLQGFAEFRQDVLLAARSGPLNVCVSNVDEKQFDKWGAGKVNDEYFKEMEGFSTLNFRILIKNNDYHLPASGYATYKWLDKSFFGEIAFYIYGQKTALISFEDNDFCAFVLGHPRLTAFYLKEFDRLWMLGKPLHHLGTR